MFGKLKKLVGQDVDLGNNANAVYSYIFEIVTKSPKKYANLHKVMCASVGTYRTGHDLIMQIISVYLNGNETRGGIATGASRVPHAVSA